jgi:hypothetical protein
MVLYSIRPTPGRGGSAMAKRLDVITAMINQTGRTPKELRIRLLQSSSSASTGLKDSPP